MAGINYSDRIPNNVDLSSDRRLQRALEKWLPNYLDWWKDMGPEGFQEKDVYLRTAISVDRDGWAHFDYVKMPEYRWGIFLSDAEQDRKVGFGDHADEPAWQQVPGEYRNALRRIIVTQGDTEPASVEQRFRLSATLVSDVRQVAVINGQPTSVGGSVDGAEVLAVDVSSVQLRVGSRTFRVRLSRRDTGDERVPRSD